MEQLTDSRHDKLHVNLDRPAADLRAVSSEPLRGPGLADMPPEIVERILAVEPFVQGSSFTRIADPFWTHKALSKTCRSLSEPSQRTVLRSIILRPQQFEEFAGDLLIESTRAKLDSLVRTLTIKRTSSAHLTVANLHVLGYILSKLTCLTELRIVDVASLTIYHEGTQGASTFALEPLRKVLEEATFPNLTLVGVYGRNLYILPNRSLEHLTLDFSVEADHELALNELLAPASPVNPAKVTIRNLVCEDAVTADFGDSRRCSLTTFTQATAQRDEERAIRRLFGSLGKPRHLILEKCRIYPSLLDCMVEMPVGQSIQILELDNVVNRSASKHPGSDGLSTYHDTPFSLEYLSSLHTVRLGAIDAKLLQQIPPSLQNLDLLTVNAFGAVEWIREHIAQAIASGRSPIPPGCKLVVHNGVARAYRDGPKDVPRMSQLPLPQTWGSDRGRGRYRGRAGYGAGRGGHSGNVPNGSASQITLVASKASEIDALLAKGLIDTSGPFARAIKRASSAYDFHNPRAYLWELPPRPPSPEYEDEAFYGSRHLSDESDEEDHHSYMMRTFSNYAHKHGQSAWR